MERRRLSTSAQSRLDAETNGQQLPQDVGPAVVEKHVAFARQKGGPAMGNALGQVLGHRDGRGPIVIAVPDKKWTSDLAQGKSPRPHGDGQVERHASQTMAHGLGVGRYQLRPNIGPGDDSLVGWCEIACELVQEPTRVSTRVLGQPHGHSKQRGRMSCHRARSPSVETEARQSAGRVHRTSTCHACGGDDPVGKFMGAGSHVRAAARETYHREARQPERVRHGRKVARPIEQSASRKKVGQSTSRPVDDDEVHAQGSCGFVVWPIEPRARRAMTEEYRLPRRIAVLGECDPAIVELDVRFQDRPSLPIPRAFGSEAIHRG